MKKKQALQIFAILSLGILVFALASIGIAFQNEPEGFRGLKWGDPPGEDMTYVGPVTKLEVYRNSLEKMQIGEVPLNDVLYCFYENRFGVVNLSFSEEKNYDTLKVILKVRYGEPTDERFNKCIWFGRKSAIHLSYALRTEKGSFTLSSVPIFTERMKAAKEEAAEKAAEDF